MPAHNTPEPDETSNRVAEQTAADRQAGIALLAKVQQFGAEGVFVGRSDAEISNLIWLIRVGCKITGLDPTQRAFVEREIHRQTGLTKREIALPPAVDVDARARRAERTRKYAEHDPNILDVDDPQDIARRFLRATEDDAGWSEYVRHQGEFFRALRTHYEAVTDEAVIAKLYAYLDGKTDVSSGDPIKADRALVENVAHALRAEALIDMSGIPAWIGSAAGKTPPDQIVPFANGRLDLNTRNLQRHSRAFFGLQARPYPYQPRATPPVRWLNFLSEIFEGDAESIETLAEIAGLLLTPNTSHQKIFLVQGPPRSGKGNILRVLRELVGPSNVCAPTLSSLGGTFGLQGLVHKLAALVSDARIGSKTDVQAIGETLLRVTGEDAVSVPRKYLDDLVLKLSVRFVIATNELPALLDQSGALASRFIALQTRKSFLGREDPGLTDKLLAELPAIANWALDGLDRLRERGHFVQPRASIEALEQLEVLGSPIKAFLAEACEVEPGASVEVAKLYQAWCLWCVQQGRDQPGTLQIFGRNLSAAVPGVRTALRRVDGSRPRFYEGIRLRVDLDGSRSLPF